MTVRSPGWGVGRRGGAAGVDGPPARQVLELPAEPGGVSAQLHEVHRQPALPAVPLHCGLRAAGHAAVRGAVSGLGPSGAGLPSREAELRADLLPGPPLPVFRLEVPPGGQGCQAHSPPAARDGPAS